MLLPGLLLQAKRALHASTHNNGSIGHNTDKTESLPGGAVKHIKECMQQAACSLFCTRYKYQTHSGNLENNRNTKCNKANHQLVRVKRSLLNIETKASKWGKGYATLNKEKLKEGKRKTLQETRQRLLRKAKQQCFHDAMSQAVV